MDSDRSVQKLCRTKRAGSRNTFTPSFFGYIRERVKERDAICNQGSLDRASRRRVSDTSRRTSRETFQSRGCDGHFNEMTAATLHETTESMQTENMDRTEEV